MDDFKGVKVGQKLWCSFLGWVEVMSLLDNTSSYPLIIKVLESETDCRDNTYESFSRSFTFNGENYKGCGQSLFWDKVKIIAPPRPIVVPPKDSKVLVWEDGESKYKRHSAGRLNKKGELHCYNFGQTSWSENITSPWKNWEIVDENN